MNAKQFSLKIEEIKRNNGDMSYMDAILHYCDENKIDPTEVGRYISKSLKEKITIEAQGLNLIEKGKTTFMTYDGFAVYRKYLAYKLHFTTDKYDYTEHSGMVHTKLETFTKRNDRYMFHKLSVKYNQDEIDDFMIANFVKKNKAWSGSLLERDSHDTYLQYKKRKEGLIIG